MRPPYTAAMLQFRIDPGEVPSNEERAFRLLAEAVRAGASLCVLPEMWSTGFAYEQGLPRLARESTPRILGRIRAFAAAHRTVVAGSLPERKGPAVCNTLFLVDADGTIAGAYRKAHLFRPSGETEHFRRGTRADAVPTAAGTVGPMICYDLRFPELSRKYFLQGADLLVVSAQWPAVRRAHWDALAVARAIENQSFVVAVNATGPSGPFRYDGGSRAVSPTGEVIASAGEEEGVTVATIDPSRVEEFRRRIPCAQDRNEQAYRRTRRRS